jgi:hypothetical protein
MHPRLFLEADSKLDALRIHLAFSRYVPSGVLEPDKPTILYHST